MDLLELSTTERFTFINPKDKKETDIVIELAYPDSKIGSRNMLAIQRKIAKLMEDENNLLDGKLKSEILEDIGFEYIASMIISWENITLNKKKLECNLENAKKILDNDLIYKFVNDKFSSMGKLIKD